MTIDPQYITQKSSACVLSFRVQVEVEKDISGNSYFSSMQQSTGLQFSYVIADPKVVE